MSSEENERRGGHTQQRTEALPGGDCRLEMTVQRWRILHVSLLIGMTYREGENNNAEQGGDFQL